MSDTEWRPIAGVTYPDGEPQATAMTLTDGAGHYLHVGPGGWTSVDADGHPTGDPVPTPSVLVVLDETGQSLWMPTVTVQDGD